MGKYCMLGNGGCVEGDKAGFWEWCVPMSSEKPPTGSRQVPVTNWSRRILFSLSISFTTCRKLSPSSCCNVHSRCVCVCVWHSVCVPARTSESACCSWCSVYKWCSSANLPGRSLASHRASTSTHRKLRSSAESPPSFIHASIRDKSRQDDAESNPIRNWNKIFSLANNVTHTPLVWLNQQAKFTLIWTQAEDQHDWENREMRQLHIIWHKAYTAYAHVSFIECWWNSLQKNCD